MDIKSLFSKLSLTKSKENKAKPIKVESTIINKDKEISPLEIVKHKTCIELLDEEVICKYDCFAGKCRRVKANPLPGQRPFAGNVAKTYILFNKPDYNPIDDIHNVRLLVDSDNETLQIPNWTWDDVIELKYEQYNNADKLYDISSENSESVDMDIVNQIKKKCLTLYKQYIGEKYTKDDIYTLDGDVIRKYAVKIYDIKNIKVKTFNTYDEAKSYYDKLIKTLTK